MFDSMLDVSVRLLIICIILLILRRTLLKNIYSKYILMMWIPVFITFIYPRGFQLKVEKTVHVNQGTFLSNVLTDQVLNAESQYNAVSLNVDWNMIAYSIWIVGMIVCVLLFATKQFQLKSMIQKSKPLSNLEFNELLHELDFTIRCVEHPDGIGAAITCNLSSVLIIFEKSFSLSRAQKRMMLMHEMVHYKERHYLVQLLIQVLKIVWWFHPGIWILGSEISRELEFRCDEVLIENKDVSLKEYAELMLFTQSGFKMNHQLGLSAKAKKTKERIEKCMMKKKKHLLFGVLIVFVISGYLQVQVKQIVKAQTYDDVVQNMQLNNHHVEHHEDHSHDIHHNNSVSVTVDDLLSEMICPIEHAQITCGYGCYVGHQETDSINTEDRNGNVYSALSGTVVSCDYNSEKGKFIIVDHGLGVKTYYHHLDKQYVQVGDIIKKGDCIGLIGKTGMSTGEHLGFMATVDDEAINIDDLFR